MRIVNRTTIIIKTDIIQFLKLTMTSETIRKNKHITNILFKIDDEPLFFVTHVTHYKHKNTESIYTNPYFEYKRYKISLDKRDVKTAIDEKNDENKIREIMKKDKGISIKKLSELTDISIYSLSRIYMKIRRENSKQNVI